ncbi:MAG: thiol:disulfide interchange protein DsbA [Plesiomonas sp.]|uniref:thiol:disulfide interchange protein DsbA n=1 Tax=Plesiomonas sp. TaxID=2486279 RepID=UPI003F3B6505
MKKIWLTLASLVLAANVSAAQFKEGKEYTALDRPASVQPEAVEFFSFYCPACFSFESTYHIPQTVRSEVPSGGSFKQYHVDFMGPLAKDLSRAWAVANVLGVEEKVAPVLFEGIQKSRSIKTPADIRAAFEKIGVNGEEYDAALNSFMVSSFVAQQSKAAQDFQVEGVPAFYINGKFRVEARGIDAKSNEDFTKQFGEIVKFLLTQK